MAESRRAPKHRMGESDEEAQMKRDRWIIILSAIGGILIIVGIILLSAFLSGN